LGVGCLLEEEGLVRLKGKTPRVPLGPLRSTSLSFVDSVSRSEPDPFLLGVVGEKPSLEADSLEGNRGANELLRGWAEGGSSDTAVKKTSDEGEETLIEIPASGEANPPSGGEDEIGILVTMVGKGCLTGLPGPEVVTEAGCKVALLLLLFLYSCTLFWKEMSAEEYEVEKLPKSSADFDQVLRDMLRRSPRPPSNSGEEGCEVGKGRCISKDFLAECEERSRTDLRRRRGHQYHHDKHSRSLTRRTGREGRRKDMNSIASRVCHKSFRQGPGVT
jgi:hypothetical protein